mgnify:CR=1 FL=1
MPSRLGNLTVSGVAAAKVHAAAEARRINLRRIDATTVGVALDETVTVEEVATIIAVFRERHQFKPGDKIRLKPDPRLAHLFDAATGQRLTA